MEYSFGSSQPSYFDTVLRAIMQVKKIGLISNLMAGSTYWFSIGCPLYCAIKLRKSLA